MFVRPTALVLFSLSLFAQDPAREGRWRADLDSLVSRITSVHPNPYTRVTKEAFQEEVEQLRAGIPNLTDRQVVLGFARILALLNDGHSNISLGQGAVSPRRYPLAFRWQSDGLFITVAPEAMARLAGCRVVAMNGKPIEEVYDSVRPWISYDTESWRRYVSQSILVMHDVLAAAGIVDDGGPVTLDVETAAGERFAATVPLQSMTAVEAPTLSQYSVPHFRRMANQDYWFDWLPAERTLYIQYNRCRENALLSIRAFANDIIEFARRNPPDRVVFDVRENSGGASIYFQQLLAALGAAYQAGVIATPPGGAYGIIGKKTFSSGSLAVRDMKQAGMILVGETTGGRVSWFGENLPWVLPNSQLTVTISTRVVGNPATGPAVDPDVAVEFRGADYFANRDPYLEAAIRVDPRTISGAGGANRP